MLDIRITIGRLVADPEFREFSNDFHTCTFRIACDDDYSKADEKRTEYIDCKAFNGIANFINDYCTKGRLVCVVGRMVTETYESKNLKTSTGDAATVRKPVLYVDKIYLLDRPDKAQIKGQQQEKDDDGLDLPQKQKQPKKLPTW